MNTLRRTVYDSSGIVSLFTFDGDLKPFMTTLEHAYQGLNGSYEPKIPPGIYDCVRGLHSLEDGIEFVTFEVTGVDGHSGLLFHVGNFNRNSKGCILCGSQLGGTPGDYMVSLSRDTFEHFMKRLDGVQRFPLEVIA